MHKLPQVAGNLIRPSIANHKPEKRRGECVLAILLYQYDVVFRVYEAPKFIGGNDPAYAAPKDHNRFSGHIPSCFSRSQNATAESLSLVHWARSVIRPISTPSSSSLLAKTSRRAARPASLDLDAFGYEFAEHVRSVVVACDGQLIHAVSSLAQRRGIAQIIG
jgi:hypothetical protein